MPVHASSSELSPMPSLASLLERKLDPRMSEMIGQAGALAAELGVEAYLVGGMVRDLVLGVTPKDPDIVVVGQAAAYAARLATELGGEAGTSSEFGGGGGKSMRSANTRGSNSVNRRAYSSCRGVSPFRRLSSISI